MATVEQSITALENLLGPHLFSLELGLGSPLILANRYWIKDIRGRGARGLVVRARDTNLERDVAIKLYPHRDAATISEAEAEAKVLAKLRHDNIVLVFDSDFADLFIDNVRVPCLFIVMEYIEGPHLRAWIANENPGPLAILDAFIEAWGNYIPEIYGVGRALMAMQETDAEARHAWESRMQLVRFNSRMRSQLSWV